MAKHSRVKPNSSDQSVQPITAPQLAENAVTIACKRIWANNGKDPALEKYTPSEIAVYLYLADRMNVYGQAWPSMARIGRCCGMSAKTAGKAVQGLIDKRQITATWGGWIHTRNKPHTAKSKLLTLVQSVRSFVVAVDRRQNEAEEFRNKSVRLARYILCYSGKGDGRVPAGITRRQRELHDEFKNTKTEMDRMLLRNELEQSKYDEMLSTLRENRLPSLQLGISMSEIGPVLPPDDDPKDNPVQVGKPADPDVIF